MLTAPITTSSFHERVLALFDSLDPDSAPTISALTMDDTDLTPDEMTSHLLALVSPWIDLCSPDPVIYNISRQVLHLEIAYAAFCGATNVIVPGPKLHHGDIDGEGVVQYAYSVQEILNIGMFVQVHIRLHMIDDPEAFDENMGDDLGSRARLKYVNPSTSDPKPKADVFGTWDAWNIIRSTCSYNARLFVGKKYKTFLLQMQWLLCSKPVTFILGRPHQISSYCVGINKRNFHEVWKPCFHHRPTPPRSLSTNS